MNKFLLEPKFPLVEAKAMAELIDHFDYPIDVKDVRTGKYIRNNIAASSVSGLSKEERVGMDIHDIAKINRINDNVVTKLIYADQKVITTSASTCFSHVFLNKEGILLVDKVIKRPILGQYGEPIAILSYAYTVTPYVDLSQLYAFYKMYYSKKNAVNQFLKYLNIGKEFVEPPTDQELRALLIMQSSVSASKYVAKLMHLSPRTIEEYKSRLRGKLKSISFDSLLSILRHYGKYEDIIL